jgi:hypothetical protein
MRKPTDPIVYLPVCGPVAELNDRAQAVWEGQGFEVRRVDCTDTCRSSGSLRRLVSVLRRQ